MKERITESSKYNSLWYGGTLVISKELSAGSLTSFIIYTITVASGFGMLTGLYSEFMAAIGASERVFELLERKPLVNWKGGKVLSSIKGTLTMENVFHFNSLKSFFFKIQSLFFKKGEFFLSITS